MKVSERALNFAIKAHEGELKRENNYVLHPMIVGDILKYYDFDDNVIAAGYLHDVVEKTSYTTEDIAILFGGDVASLIMTAAYPKGINDWTEKRKTKIKNSQNLPNRNKAVILADQIAHLEEHKIITKNDYFSKFYEIFEKQKWFNEELFNSLASDAIHTELEPLIERLYNNISILFYNLGDKND